jgi:hypothetical protein
VGLINRDVVYRQDEFVIPEHVFALEECFEFFSARRARKVARRKDGNKENGIINVGADLWLPLGSPGEVFRVLEDRKARAELCAHFVFQPFTQVRESAACMSIVETE